MSKFPAKRIAYDGVMTAIALTIFVVEAQIPLPIPAPGVKLGLSNVVTLFALFAVGPLDAFVILTARILLGSLFAGSVTTLIYSLAGGFFCFLVTLLLRKLVTKTQVWVCGAFGAIAHVAAQLVVARFLTGTAEIVYYLPVLVLSATLTGSLTGLATQFVLKRTEKLFSFKK